MLFVCLQPTAQSESINSSLASPYVTTDRSSEETDLFKLLSNTIKNGSLLASSTEDSSTQRVFVPVTQPTKVQRKRGSTHPSGAEGKVRKTGHPSKNVTSTGDSREALSHEGSDPVSLALGTSLFYHFFLMILFVVFKSLWMPLLTLLYI